MKRSDKMTLGAILLVMGFAAGFFAGLVVLSSHADKLKFQWDIGNTFVGLATIALASVYFFNSRSEAKSAHSSKIAELRVQWIEAFRSDCSNFLSEAIKISLRPFTRIDPEERIGTIGSRIWFLESIIIMKLNENDTFHSAVAKEVDEIRSLCVTLISGYASKKADENWKTVIVEWNDKEMKLPDAHLILSDMVRQFSKTVRLMTKNEWDQAQAAYLAPLKTNVEPKET